MAVQPTARSIVDDVLGDPEPGVPLDVRLEVLAAIAVHEDLHHESSPLPSALTTHFSRLCGSTSTTASRSGAKRASPG